MDWAKVWDVVKKGLRAGGAATVGAIVANYSGDKVLGVSVAVVYGLIGKILRDAKPGWFGWLPVL